ncbi:MAG: GNAT family N-acetyltransferase [Phycisphaerae bacterium]
MTSAPPADLVVRPAHLGDLAPLSFFFDTALRKDYFVRRGQLQEILSGPHHSVYVAEIDAVLVGVAITTAGARLVNALVHPAYRGLGIGRALVEQSGAKQVRAKIDMSTGDPRGFYSELGFRETGERNEKGNIELMVRDDEVEGRASAGRRCVRANSKRGNNP